MELIGLYICLAGERSRRTLFGRLPIRIGSDQDNDLVLRDGHVDAKACELDVDGPMAWRITVTSSVRVEFKELPRGDSKLADGTHLVIGDYTIILALVPGGDPIEAQLLVAIGSGDEASRIVYADWLEQTGDAKRAEFVRLQDTMVTCPLAVRPHYEARVRELCATVARDPQWRRCVSRPAIMRCPRQPCSQEWGALAPTDRPDVRTCHHCNQAVPYCSTVGAAMDCERHVKPHVVDLALDMTMRPVVGRPFEIDRQPRRAALVRRADWCSTKT